MSEIIDQMVTHLEFLGYVPDRQEAFIRLTHTKYLNFVLKEFGGGVLLSDYFIGNAHAKETRPEFVDFVNKMNQQATVARFYLDDETDLVVEAWLPAFYDKAIFAATMDAWQRDGSRLLGHEQANSFLS